VLFSSLFNNKKPAVFANSGLKILSRLCRITISNLSAAKSATATTNCYLKSFSLGKNRMALVTSFKKI